MHTYPQIKSRLELHNPHYLHNGGWVVGAFLLIPIVAILMQNPPADQAPIIAVKPVVKEVEKVFSAPCSLMNISKQGDCQVIVKEK